MLVNHWIEDFAGRSRFCCDLTDHMGSIIFFRGAYSREQLRLLPGLLPEGSIFIDVGANQGEFSVFAAALPNKVHVFAFEPGSAARARLEKNIAANALQNVTIFPFGLSSETQHRVPIFGGSGQFTDGTRHSGLPTLFQMENRQQVLEHIEIETLDHVLQYKTVDRRIALIKIDVEGAELHVLKGALGTIAAQRPHILFEANEPTCRAAGYSTDDLFGWLDSQKYSLQHIQPSGRLAPLNRKLEFSNVLATPQEKAGVASD